MSLEDKRATAEIFIFSNVRSKQREKLDLLNINACCNSVVEPEVG